MVAATFIGICIIYYLIMNSTTGYSVLQTLPLAKHIHQPPHKHHKALGNGTGAVHDLEIITQNQPHPTITATPDRYTSLARDQGTPAQNHNRPRQESTTDLEPKPDIRSEQIQNQGLVTGKQASRSDSYYNHGVIISPTSVCSLLQPPIVTYVHSRAYDPVTRDIIRQTWANVSEYNHTSMRVVFIVGREASGSHQRLIQDEANEHGDLLQCDFIDTYRNLTRKQLCAMNWILKNCPGTELITKVDDDVFINVYRLIAFYHVYRNTSPLPSSAFHCLVIPNPKPMRNGSKWKVSHQEYAHNKYPPYCVGFAHIVAPAAARRVTIAARDTPFFWIDDVFVTGILRQRANVALVEFDAAAGFRGIVNRMKFSYMARVVGKSMFIIERVKSEQLEVWTKLSKILKQSNR